MRIAGQPLKELQKERIDDIKSYPLCCIIVFYRDRDVSAL